MLLYDGQRAGRERMGWQPQAQACLAVGPSLATSQGKHATAWTNALIQTRRW